MQVMEAEGMIHCDLKPENILLRPETNPVPKVKVIGTYIYIYV